MSTPGDETRADRAVPAPAATTRWRQVRAVLAGGLVVGVGASMTLAAWTDEVSTTATLGTSRFDVQANVSSPYSPAGPWADHDTLATAGELSFSVGASALTPGDVVYAPLALRTAVGSVAGTVTVQGATTTGSAHLAGALRYRLVRHTGACDATAFDSPAQWLVGSSGPAPLSTGSAADALALGAATEATPGTPVRLCFEVRLPGTTANENDATLQGQDVTATWTFPATSS